MTKNTQSILEMREALKEMVELMHVMSVVQLKQLEIANAPESITSLIRDVSAGLERVLEAQAAQAAAHTIGPTG